MADTSDSRVCCFFFTDPSPTEIYTLSLHDALTKMARSGDELPEAAGVDPLADLHRDPSTRAHAPMPEGVPVRVAHRHVDVRPATDARRHVVDPELQVLVHRGLKGEGSDDPRREMSLRRGHVRLFQGEPVLLTQ